MPSAAATAGISDGKRRCGVAVAVAIVFFSARDVVAQLSQASNDSLPSFVPGLIATGARSRGGTGALTSKKDDERWCSASAMS
mmetsp:Transcript_8262/g.30651  ORF Transcript_8262/g.30651 Transcript_8262/m.30651 type:complete len:83 (+) Transcript_8262:436-684(+)